MNLLLRFLPVVVLLLSMPILAPAASIREAMPESTMLLVELPAPQKFVDHLRTTRLGALLTDAKRIDAVLALFKKSEDGAAWKRMLDNLAEDGLTPEDVPTLLSGRLGMAMGMPTTEERQEDKDGEVMPLVTFWIEPGEALITRMRDSLMQDRPNRRHRITKDTIAGRAVFIAESNPDYKPKDDEDEDGQDEAQILLYEGGRALCFMTSQAQLPALRTHAATVLGRLAGDGSGGMQARLQSLPHLNTELPGATMLDLHADHRKLLSMLDEHEREEAEKMLRAFGLDQSQGASLRLALDAGGILRCRMRVHLPEPHQGFSAIFDGQHVRQGELPAWMGADLISAGRMALSLPKLRTAIIEVFTAMQPDQAGVMVGMVEGMIAGQLGMPLATLLDAFGTDWSFGLFPDKGDAEAEVPTRMALMVDAADAETLASFLNKLAPSMGGAIEDLDGQVRLSFPGAEGAQLILAHKKLILAIGEGVGDAAVANLANPPAGDAALANAAWAKRAIGLLGGSEPAIGFSIDDQSRAMEHSLDQMRTLLDEAPTGLDLGEMIEAIAPAEADLKAAFDVGASGLRMLKDGLAIDMLFKLPAK